MERPPRWAIVLMVAGLAAMAVLLPKALSRHPADPGSSLATLEAATRVTEPLRILAVGDSYTAGSDFGGYEERRWPALVADELDVTVDVAAAGGSGYIARGPTNQTFRDLLADAAGDYDAVVILGSRHDVAPPARMRAAAADTYDAVAEAWPEAELLVVGPPWVNDEPPTSLLAARDAIAAAADVAGATFVDPLDDGWFADGDLISPDRINPSHEGHRFMAEKISPALVNMLGLTSAG